MNARMNSRTPMKAKTMAATTFWNIEEKTSVISLASHVVAGAEEGAVVGAVRARIVADRARDVLHLGRAHRCPAAYLGHHEEHDEQRAEGGIDGMLHRSVVIVVVPRGGIVALLPPRALHPPRAQRDEDRREREQRQAEQVRRERGHVAADDDAILEEWSRHLRLGQDAQEVLPRRDAGQHGTVAPRALAPVAVRVATVVVAHLAAELVRRSRRLVHERVL